ncbi:MAG: glycosyltransferase, partial [Pararhizobium sp.]
GRRQMRSELIPLLHAAKGRARPPLILASVRDILQENRKPERDLETVEHLEAFYDGVLVHADPTLIRLDATFPHAHRIRDKVLYTGIVAPKAEEIRADGPAEFDVVVSVGGGVFGRDLLFAAAGAKALSSMRDRRWLFVTGINTAECDVAHLRRLVDDTVRITPFVPNLGSVVAQAELSISRAGYNTVADVYRAGCRAVVVALSNGEETEQIRRTDYLAASGLAVTVDAHDQQPETVAAAINQAMAAPPPDRSRIDIEGAPRSAEIVEALLEGCALGRYR